MIELMNKYTHTLRRVWQDLNEWKGRKKEGFRAKIPREAIVGSMFYLFTLVFFLTCIL